MLKEQFEVLLIATDTSYIKGCRAGKLRKNIASCMRLGFYEDVLVDTLPPCHSRVREVPVDWWTRVVFPIFFRKGIGRCTPSLMVSHSSAFLGKLRQEFRKGGSD